MPGKNSIKEKFIISIRLNPRIMEKLEIKRIKSKSKKIDFYGELIEMCWKDKCKTK